MGVDNRSPREIFSSLALVFVEDYDNVRFGGFLRLEKDGEGLRVFDVSGAELEEGDSFRTTQGEIVELDEAVDLYPTEFGGYVIAEVTYTDEEVTLASGEIGDFLRESAAEEEKPADSTTEETPVS